MTQQRKRATIREVAKATGLSPAAVSYALRGIQTSEETQERVRRAAPDARIHGFLLSEMVPAGTELILGTRRDPLFGPLVMAGLGGVTAELFQDVAIRLAPVGPAEALEMLESLKSFPLLDGWRGGPKADIEAAVDAIVALSALAAANAGMVSRAARSVMRKACKS